MSAVFHPGGAFRFHSSCLRSLHSSRLGSPRLSHADHQEAPQCYGCEHDDDGAEALEERQLLGYLPRLAAERLPC